MISDYYFCIPSYMRSSKQETLMYLLGIGVAKDNIYIFVQTEDDYNLYSIYKDECNIIYAKASSVPEARNNILDYFGVGKTVIMMDDDISNITVGSKIEGLISINNRIMLGNILDSAVKISAFFGAHIFGFYPVCNAYFMSNTIDTKKPINTIIGFRNGASIHFNNSFIAKEDIELCGRIINHGGAVVRFNNVAFDAKHRTNSGGANELWKSGVNSRYAAELQRMYPRVYSVKRSNPEELTTITKGGRHVVNGWGGILNVKDGNGGPIGMV